MLAVKGIFQNGVVQRSTGSLGTSQLYCGRSHLTLSLSESCILHLASMQYSRFKMQEVKAQFMPMLNIL